jgi:hypothetical protein
MSSAAIAVRNTSLAFSEPVSGMIRLLCTLHGKRFTSNTLQALCHKFGFKNNAKYCWQGTEGVLTKYPNDLIARMKSLSEQEVQRVGSVSDLYSEASMNSAWKLPKKKIPSAPSKCLLIWPRFSPS